MASTFERPSVYRLRAVERAAGVEQRRSWTLRSLAG
jgi:hypothetical protein